MRTASSLRSTRLGTLALAAALALGSPAWAHDAASEASALSMVPVAVSVAGAAVLPVAAASGTLALTVVAVQAVAAGTVLVLSAAATGAVLSVQLAGRALVAVGAGVVVLATATGWVLSTAADAGSQALCFIPNEVGASLLYNERVTR
jgi:hypothetical protein